MSHLLHFLSALWQGHLNFLRNFAASNKYCQRYTLYIPMTQQGPQSTHNKSDVHRPSAYERMNSEIENFINQVAEEKKQHSATCDGWHTREPETVFVPAIGCNDDNFKMRRELAWHTCQTKVIQTKTKWLWNECHSSLLDCWLPFWH